VEGAIESDANRKDTPMSCGNGQSTEAPCCCPGKCDYYEVARKLAVSGSQNFLTETIEVKDANVIEVDAQDFSSAVTVASVTVQVQTGNDSINWTQQGTSPAITFQGPGSKSGVLAGVSAKYARLVLRVAGRNTRISGGIRLRTEAPKLTPPNEGVIPGLEAPVQGRDEDYVLLADRLSVAPAASAILAPVSMAGRNTVQLEITVIQTTGGLPISVDLQASNDTQTWETLRSYTGLGYGYSSPASFEDVTHKYVRVRVNGPQALGPAEIALGMALSRT
jgi:hypothetical protein